MSRIMLRRPLNVKIEGNSCVLILYTFSQFLGKTEEDHEELVEWPVCGFYPESLYDRSVRHVAV